MEITGRIVAVLPEAGGISKSGKAWKKREYVLETTEQYPKKVCFQLFNDKADQYPMQVGQEVKVSFDIESREYNGRWYTQVSAYKVENINAQPTDVTPSLYHQPVQTTQQQIDPNPAQRDDLPF